jgi:hypothetical protein
MQTTCASIGGISGSHVIHVLCLAQVGSDSSIAWIVAISRALLGLSFLIREHDPPMMLSLGGLAMNDAAPAYNLLQAIASFSGVRHPVLRWCLAELTDLPCEFKYPRGLPPTLAGSRALL